MYQGLGIYLSVALTTQGFKGLSTRLLVINSLRKPLAILGCLLFLFSVVHPFYHVAVGGSGFSSKELWSFKDDVQYWVGMIPQPPPENFPIYLQLWFSNYWFSSLGFFGLGIPWILISLFIVQVLTLIFGVALIVSNRRILSFEPIIFSTAALVLMTYAAKVISNGAFLFVSFQYQLGYYLVYPSVVLFVCAFALNEAVKKRQTASRDTSIPVKTSNVEIFNPHSNRR